MMLSVPRFLAFVLLVLVAWSARATPCEDACRAVSENGHFIVTARSADEPVPLRRHHSWIVTVSDSQGRPLSGVDLAVAGGMPGHGHGLPSRPTLGERLGEGRYRIDGLLFNMHGDWLLRLGIQAGALRDEARLNFRLDY